MLYLIEPDGLVNLGYANFQKDTENSHMKVVLTMSGHCRFLTFTDWVGLDTDILIFFFLYGSHYPIIKNTTLVKT